MSFAAGGVAELLYKGLAAAQSGDERDHAEAEFYLDWAIRAGASLEEQIDAWLWLSRIAATPERKRECLENVLAIRPSHPDARRDMAILEGRLRPEEMRADPWAPGRATGAGGAAGEARRFPCPGCGASLLFQPGSGLLSCQFCGASVGEDGKLASEAPSAGSFVEDVAEQDWVKAIYTNTGHDWHLPQSRVLVCGGCGATVTFMPGRISTACLYCASPYTVRAAPEGTSLREPDGVLLFKLDRGEAMQKAREWLLERSEKGDTESDVARLATLHDLSPVYLPFWTFDVGGEVRWSGYVRDDLGIGADLHDIDNTFNVGLTALGVFTGNFELAANGVANIAQAKAAGRSLTYSEGAVPVSLNDVMVPAARSVPPKLLDALKYTPSEGVPYREEMLASWPAEVYTVAAADASLLAREAALEQSDRDIELFTGAAPAGPGDEPAIRKDRRGLTVLSYKLLLAPLWAAGYTYRGKVYRLAVNGQTGRVEGYLPKREGVVSRLFAQGG